MSSPPCVDIAIVNYFSAHDVRRCLERLGAWPHGVVWLIDNSADEAQLAALREATRGMDWVHLVEAGRNLGFGQACNLAFEQSASELFLLLNPDAQVLAGDLRAMAQALADNPKLGAVSPRIYWNERRSFVLPDAFPQTPALAVWQVVASRLGPVARAVARRYLARQRLRMGGNAPFEVDFVAGAVLMVRRAAARAAGGLFDPEYFMFYEDSDLSLRLRRAGWRLAIVPTAGAMHEYRHKAFKADLMMQSRSAYFRKRYPWFFRATAGLARIDRLARPVPAHWYEQLRPCRTLADFERQTAGRGVLAFSPSMLAMPAIFRPLGTPARAFSEDEWALLEPAEYVALLDGIGPETAARWVRFQRER